MPKRYLGEWSDRWNNIFTSFSFEISTWMVKEMTHLKSWTERISVNSLSPASAAGWFFAWFEGRHLAFFAQGQSCSRWLFHDGFSTKKKGSFWGQNKSFLTQWSNRLHRADLFWMNFLRDLVDIILHWTESSFLTELLLVLPDSPFSYSRHPGLKTEIWSSTWAEMKNEKTVRNSK